MPAENHNKKLKILLVDNVKLFLEVEKTFFLRRGYEVFIAHSGDEVLAMAREKFPDLILMDYEMQGMNGDEVCRAVKADPKLRAIPVIIISQHYSKEILERCLQAGCVDYLTKPVDQSVLLRRVSEVLNISDRRHIRATVMVTIDRGVTKTQFLGKALNISESGLFLETTRPLEIGSSFKISFLLPRVEQRVTGTGEVVRLEGIDSPRTYGAGLRFRDLSEPSLESIRHYVKLETG